MIKVGCIYYPKSTRMEISKYPKYCQIADMENFFYKIPNKKESSKLKRLVDKNTDFEFVLNVNRFITHKFSL